MLVLLKNNHHGYSLLMFTYLWNDPSRQTAYMWPWLPKAQIQAHSWVKKNTLWFPGIRRAQHCSDHLNPPHHHHRSWSWPPGLGAATQRASPHHYHHGHLRHGEAGKTPLTACVGSRHSKGGKCRPLVQAVVLVHFRLIISWIVLCLKHDHWSQP